jgi:hypothetical protein
MAPPWGEVSMHLEVGRGSVAQGMDGLGTVVLPGISGTELEQDPSHVDA